MADINLSTGIYIPSQLPLDSKRYVKTLAELTTLGTNDAKAFVYYEGLSIFCVENQKEYRWREAALNEQGGLLTTHFTYPANSISNGIDYSNREFNLFIITTESTQENLPDEILGGNVVWIEDLDFISTVIIYRINGIIYYAPITPHTLANADTTLNRIDVFAVNTNSELIVKQGVLSAAPEEPVINFGTELRVTAVYIPANATSPLGLSSFTIYNENLQAPTEFDTTVIPIGSNPTMVDFASNVDPSLDTVGINITNWDSQYQLAFRYPTYTVSPSALMLTFTIKLKTTEKFGLKLITMFEGIQTGEIELSSDVIFVDMGNTIDHQLVQLPIEDFNLSNPLLDTLIIALKDTETDHPGFFIDNIRIVSNNAVNTFNGTYLGLFDTDDTTYNTIKGYTPYVNNAETGLKLKNPILIPIDGCLVIKDGANTDIDTIEAGDRVFLREVDDNGSPVTLFGQTYDGGGLDDRANYTQNHTIDI